MPTFQARHVCLVSHPATPALSMAALLAYMATIIWPTIVMTFAP